MYGLDNSCHGLDLSFVSFLILSIKWDRAFINNSQSNLMRNIIIILNLCFYCASWGRVHSPLTAQVGEANDLLPDIAAKAANLKVVT